MIVRIERKVHKEPYKGREVIYWRIIRHDPKTGTWEFVGAEPTRFQAMKYCEGLGLDLSKIDVVR